ncbi:AraC family transcriptional regulator [Vibrio sp. RE86]|uniref:helix-turn-helix domain-containing protein n=1 Tax=Vibrio sp. RE86 TaxID=2607605 RepID=UPI0014934938|nr:AraC family transcriptional regulator [Vibrio sp. RE86]
MAVATRQAGRIQKIAITQKIENSERQMIVGQTPHGRSALVEGKFISHSMDSEFSIHAAQCLELEDSNVISMAPASIIITVLLKGELDFGYDDLSFSIDGNKEGQVAIVNLSQPASFRRRIIKDNNVTKLNLMLSHHWLKKRISGQCSLSDFMSVHKNHLQLSVNQDVKQMVEKVLLFDKVESFSEQIAIESLSFQLIEALMGQIDLHKLPLTNKPSDTVDVTSIEDIVCFIEANLSESHSAQSLATRFAMSTSNLQRKFKLQLGITLNSYIRTRRLNVAKQHLQRGLVSVTEAAYEAGYNHPANFTNAFKKEFGVPPLDIVSDTL